MEYKATILAVADASHYLVGATDLSGSFHKLPQLTKVVMCESLSAAKNLLREHKIDVAQLTMQTAYDEMCGLATCNDYHETINL